MDLCTYVLILIVQLCLLYVFGIVSCIIFTNTITIKNCGKYHPKEDCEKWIEKKGSCDGKLALTRIIK